LKTSGIVVAVSLASSLVGVTLIPAEHLHESDETHPSAFVHRHLALPEHESSDRSASQFDHADPHVVWLTSAWLHQPSVHLDQPAVAAEAIIAAPTATPRRLKRRFDDIAPPHGPPGTRQCLRAPPSTPA